MTKIVPVDAVLIPEQAQRVFEGDIFDVYQWPQKLYDGSEATFEMLRRPDGVMVICILDDKLLVQEDEQPHRGKTITFPAGRVDKGEDTLAAAKREVREETGYEFSQWRLVEVTQPFKKIEWFAYTYVAWDVVGKGSPSLDPGERITVKQAEFDEVQRLVDARVGYMRYVADLFRGVDDVPGLLRLPEYKGRQI
jgi:ADP-ribose pyrophosphatase